MKHAARIMVVDDEPGIVRAVERVLGGLSRVVGCQSSREAIALAGEFEPDVALLDVRMPGLDGFELMARLKADHPGIDVIMMTGSLDDLDQKLIRAIRGRAFYFIQKPFDRELLQTLVDRCLELRWRRAENRRHVERLEQELREARIFQQGLLPPPETSTDQIAISSRSVSCSELGGDLCDYVMIEPGKVALLIADVMGHGVSAAMLTGVVKSAFRTSERDGYEPAAVVRRLRGNMAAFGPERFVTLIAAVMSADDERLVYVNAGHPPGIVTAPETAARWLRSTGPLVSPALPASMWEQATLPMTAGERLLLYTDGVSEPLAGDHDVGEDEMLAAARQHAECGATLLDSLLTSAQERLGARSHADDLTLLTAAIVRRR
jgi:sigma-B regulation protein RsbU (phosphoserine phosphatase)